MKDYWLSLLLMAIPVIFILSFVFSLGQIFFLFLIILVVVLYVYCYFIDFVNKFIVIIGSFINKKIISKINDIIRSARQMEVVGKYIKKFLHKVDEGKIICLEEPFGYHWFGFKTNKGCSNLLKKQRKQEKRNQRKQEKYQQNKQQEKNRRKQDIFKLFKQVFYSILSFIIFVGFLYFIMESYR